MEAEYKRDLEHNYLIIKADEMKEMDSYCLRMAEQNEIQGLLEFHSAWRDGILYLNYDITGKQSLQYIFSKRFMNSEDLKMILSGIRQVLETLQKYLLNPAQLVFCPEYMFLSSDRKSMYLCYLPGQSANDSVAALAEFILKRLNHEDRQAVEIGYRFYQETLEENFSLAKALRELNYEDGTSHNQLEAKEEAEELYYEEKWKKESLKQDNFIEQEPKAAKKWSKDKLADQLFQRIHPAVLLSWLVLLILLELAFYFRLLNLTEAGGCFFLFTAAEVLVNQYWKHRKEEKKRPRPVWEAEEESQEYEELRAQMYSTEIQEEAEEIEETRCFLTEKEERCVRLICISAENKADKMYPDIESDGRCIKIGKRKGEADVILDSPTVSRLHAQLESDGERFYIEDLNSKNGTCLNGQRLLPMQKQELSAGDTVAFAEIEYLVYFTRNQ